MKIRRATILALCLTASAVAVTAAQAAPLPPIRTSDTNAVPACATPGRLMTFIKTRNKRLNPAFNDIAAEYMRHGEKLGVRWDYAFFQMMVETANLAFTGDVRATQNNFAGLGATGGVPGESFKDVTTGVRAHLEHVLLYAGAQIDNPVAERTRKLQEWKVLASWYKNIKGPLTYSDLAKRWAPGSNGYPRDIASVGDSFYKGACGAPDPSLVAAAAPSEPATATTMPADASPEQTASIASNVSTPTESQPQAPAKILNEQKAEASPAATDSPPATEYQTAAAGTATSQADPAPSPPAADTPPTSNAAQRACRVWTASYGGQKAIIVKATVDKTVNYTVLDVNEGKEKREAEAYIAAYAKGGETVGEFATQNLALDKAFELCPEG